MATHNFPVTIETIKISLSSLKIYRHFTLTRTTLSYSKTPTSPPLKIISLWKPSPLSLTLNANSILTLSRGHTPLLLLTASSPVTLETWMETMATLISNCEDKWVENSGRLVSLVGAEKIGNPDCSGWVWKLGRRVKSWGRRFCVLKDAVVYFFNSQQGEVSFWLSWRWVFSPNRGLCSRRVRVSFDNSGTR